ncbi:MAG: hypothetical protein NT138_20555 [Planctomycetales bacterium]|nr:hypothetical protein [Planctomycetales bacterium]
MFQSVRFSPAIVASFVITCLGCGGNAGPELSEVTGKVTLDGQPLAKVSLQFTPESSGGSPSYGVTDSEGTYELQFSMDRSGAMPGKHRVEILPVEPETDDGGKPVEGSLIVKIPPRYSQPGSLTADVQTGSNNIDFVLDSK